MQDACAASPACLADGKDLTWFFHEWLNQGGILQLSGSWHYDSAAKQLHISLDQTQTQGLYRMPIEIGVTMAAPAAGNGGGRGRGGNAGSAQPKIIVDKQHNELTLPMDAEPVDVKLDPNGWVTMMQATFAKK